MAVTIPTYLRYLRYLRSKKTQPMFPRNLFICCLTLLFSCASPAIAQDGSNIKVVLVGDSTTIGNTPRDANPDGPHLEKMIEIIAQAQGLPQLEVINTGVGGETAKRLLASGHYDRVIAPIQNVDYVFIRLGINDWFRCENRETEFPAQMHAVITRLKTDHPQAVIILSTVCPFGEVDINGLIKKIAEDEGLPLFDLHTPYQKFLDENGPHSLNVRVVYVDQIDEGYHELLKPYTHFRKGWSGRRSGDVVKMNDNLLDPLFGHIKGWYDDRHPNSAGYNLIAAETVKYLKPVLADKLSDKPDEHLPQPAIGTASDD